MKVTVLTPAYNRAYIINRLYESLVKQTNKEFEWLVVDDGSQDNTRQLISEYIEQNKIPVRYIWQENGGKHRALNTGIKNIESQLVFIVDTDDYLVDNAIEEIVKVYEKYSDDSSICGFSFLRCFPDMTINGQKFKSDEYISDYISCRLNEGVAGDKAEAYRTECLKEFPFLEVEGERFLFEDYVWMQMAEKYNTVHFNIPIYVGDYLEDGLTKNISKTKYRSPRGMMERSRVMCSVKCSFKNRLKGMILYIAYGRIAGVSWNELFKNNPYKMLFAVSFLPGVAFRVKLDKENKE